MVSFVVAETVTLDVVAVDHVAVVREIRTPMMMAKTALILGSMLFTESFSDFPIY